MSPTTSTTPSAKRYDNIPGVEDSVQVILRSLGAAHVLSSFADQPGVSYSWESPTGKPFESLHRAAKSIALGLPGITSARPKQRVILCRKGDLSALEAIFVRSREKRSLQGDGQELDTLVSYNKLARLISTLAIQGLLKKATCYLFSEDGKTTAKPYDASISVTVYGSEGSQTFTEGPPVTQLTLEPVACGYELEMPSTAVGE